MDDRHTGFLLGTVVTVVTIPFSPANALLGGAAAGYVAAGDRRTGVLTGAGAGVVGSAAGGVALAALVYVLLSGLVPGPVSTSEWVRGLVELATLVGGAAAATGAVAGAAGGVVGTELAAD